MSKKRQLNWVVRWQFQQVALAQAKELFNLLDKNLRPNVFLVGINLNEDNPMQIESVWVEPANSSYREISILELNINLNTAFEEHPLRNSLENQDDLNIQNALFNTILSMSRPAAILSTIRERDKAQGVISFCSVPQDVGDCLVSVVLQFDSKAYDSYSPLDTYHHGIISLPTSLVEAVARLFLKECARDLASQTPGGNLIVVDRMDEEIIRVGGSQFMRFPAAKSSVESRSFLLFAVCNQVSSDKYETRECKGKIIVARKGHPDIKVIIPFVTPVELTSFKLIRKLLEISDDKTALLANAEEVYGIGEKLKSYEAHKENQDLFEVVFNGHYRWDLVHSDTPLMQVSYGLPNLYKPPIKVDTFAKEVRKGLQDVTDEQIDKLWPLIDAARVQDHGTTLVIVKNASYEANRLEKQATRVEPAQLSSDMMKRVSAIDGAVLVDLEANCHAIGVILDGQPSDRADSSRGARYNSAIRYVDSEEGRFAVVVSVDGGINFIYRLQENH